MIAMTLLILELAAAVVLAWQSIARFNAMKGGSCRVFAIAWAAIGGAAASVISAVLTTGAPADWRTVLLIIAVAVLSVLDRRRAG